MTRQLTERYLQARRIALMAMDLEGEAREAAIAAEVAGDEELEREVRWLIASAEDERTTPLPPGPAHVDLSGLDAQADAPRHYTLLRRLGEGGMGVVYLAERRDGDFVQQVALKFLTAGAEGSPILLERFTRERKLLARLDHPGIARLLDGGVLADGRPFLALEYVEGERIDAWCDRHRLDLRGRIALFLKVCEAVACAHRSLVIHRDLKPANILVTAAGQPKLLDFGIARLIDTGSDTTLTETGAQALTLAYASPEQIERQPLTTAADVYSLGVVLYQLVCGRRPFQHLPTPHLMSNAIVEGDVVPPSRNMAGSTGREDGPPAPPLRVPTDVDAIVLKAMRRRASERYASVGELAADLRRFLDRRPVQARRGRRLYRLKRFVQRNRWGLAAAVAVTVAVLGGLGASLSALSQARTQQHLAELRQHQLERMARFQQRVFESVDIDAMGRALGTAERARLRSALPAGAASGIAPGALEAGVARAFVPGQQTDIARGVLDDFVVTHALDSLDSAFDNAPLTRADLRHSLARVLLGIGSYGHAERELRRVLKVRGALLPAGDRAVLSARIDLGRALYRQGDMAGALRQFDRAAGDGRVLPASDPLRVAAEAGRARVLFAQGHMQQALAQQQALLARLKTRLPPTASGLLALRNDLVATLMGLGRRDEATAQAKPLVALYRQSLGTGDPRTLDAMLTLARLLHYRYEYEQSLTLARRVAAIRVRRLGADHPDTLAAQAMVATDEVYLAQDPAAFAAAGTLLRQVIDARRRVLGADHPDTIASMAVMVRLLAKQADAAPAGSARDDYRKQAVAMERRILASHRRMLGADHPDTLMALGSLASLLDSAGQYPQALEAARQTLAGQRRVLGADHPIVSATQTLIGDIDADAGDWAAAREAYRQALDSRERLLGMRDAHTIETASRLRVALVHLHDPTAARAVQARYIDPVIAMDPAHLNASMRSIRQEAIEMLHSP